MIRTRCKFLRLFYFLKPVIPRKLQLKVRKKIARRIRKIHHDDWPVNYEIKKMPENWKGWPDNKQFALVLRHDVESLYGISNIWRLIKLEEELGFKSSFNFSPERYKIPEKLIEEIKNRGYEVGLHGLSHDGKLYSSKREFRRRSVRINDYMNKWEIKGFVSPSSHHNLEWISELNISYDSSTFDTDPFEPQNDAVNSIFPFSYRSKKTGKVFIELPYTLPQDLTLFVILGEKDTNIWKKKIDWLVENKAMILLNTHPDYMHFEENEEKNCLYHSSIYKEILEYIQTKYKNKYINYLPCEIAEFWKNRQY